jgi:cell shape-determining protein MreC
MGWTPGELLGIQKDDLTEEEQTTLREEALKAMMKNMTITKLRATAVKRENARLKQELADAARNTGNVTSLHKK